MSAAVRVGARDRNELARVIGHSLATPAWLLQHLSVLDSRAGKIEYAVYSPGLLGAVSARL